MNCINCENAIFDALWGEFKCAVYKRRVYDHEMAECKYYSKGTPKESKDNDDYHAYDRRV